MNADEARSRFAAARVARLATVGDGAPHLVPVVFAVLDGDQIVSAVDHKPKRTVALRRLDNIRANPSVSLLVDVYDEDWSLLWWARADGLAVVRDGLPPAVDALVAKYPQYAGRPPAGPVIVVSVSRWSGWAAAS